MIGRRELPRWWREFNGRDDMPLGPYMLHCVVRIIGDKRNPHNGKLERKPLGTGFCIQVPSESAEGGWYPYIATAHHVIDGQPNPELVFPDPYRPGELYPPVATSGPDWTHPIEELDLALLPFVRPDGYFLNSLLTGMHLLPHLPADTMLALPFHYVGLLEPLDRAMARSGTLGAVYETGIKHKDGYGYEAHLGDCRSYGGFSGSPCFAEFGMAGLTPTEPPVPAPPEVGPVGNIKYLHLLCGMVTWHLEPTVEVEGASAYGVVAILTSDEIWRALMSDDLAEDRRRRDEMGDVPQAKMVNLSASGTENAEYERFADLTRDLLRVPKKELDEKRSDEEGQ
jgi:hypothetical protein